MAEEGGEPGENIGNYDLDEDFPEYANDQNKELNQIVSSIEALWANFN